MCKRLWMYVIKWIIMLHHFCFGCSDLGLRLMFIVVGIILICDIIIFFICKDLFSSFLSMHSHVVQFLNRIYVVENWCSLLLSIHVLMCCIACCLWACLCFLLLCVFCFCFCVCCHSCSLHSCGLHPCSLHSCSLHSCNYSVVIIIFIIISVADDIATLICEC